MFRRKTIIAAAVLAALGFIVLRVVYRSVFGGAGGGSTVLWDLESVSLPGPLSHVVIGGQMTLEGLGNTALSALPFAGVILLAGSIVALWDPRKIMFYAPSVKRGSSLLIAAGLALATIPIIAKESQLIRRSLAMRGTRGGFRILVPLLEKTLERSLSLARALHTRGVWGTRTSSTLASKEGGLSLDAVSLPARGLEGLSWTLLSGSRVVLTGATGSGKTTVLETIAGVVNLRGDSPLRGTVSSSLRNVGYLPHDPSSIFLTNRVVDDVALSLTLRGRDAHEAAIEASRLLQEAGGSDLANRSPDSLSSGETVRAALAVLLAAGPDLLLLDEPLSSLSDSSTMHLLKIINDYAEESGATVIMTVHPRHDDVLKGFEYWQLGEQGITPGVFLAPKISSLSVPFPAIEPEPVLEVRELSRVMEGRSIVDCVSLTIGRGQLVALVGDNGAGKTTMLESIAHPVAGEVFVRGSDLVDRAIHRRCEGVALVPSTPSDLFVTSRVREELAFADRCSGVKDGFTEETLRSLWVSSEGSHGLERLIDVHPRDLSRGQQAALAVAIQLSHKPLVLLLDEPFRGLDERAQTVMAEVIGCVVETGTAVVVATHRSDHCGLRWDRVLLLKDGRLQETQEKVR